MTEEDLVYGDWQGGHAQGWIEEKTSSFRLRENSTNGSHTFAISDYGGDREAALAACMAFRYQYALSTNRVKNRWRSVMDRILNIKWAEVRLTQGKVMLCDLQDLELVSTRAWVASCHGKNMYAIGNSIHEGKRKLVYFHRLITGYDMVDHISGETLDNRKINLRPTTPFLNVRNITECRNKKGRRIHGVHQEGQYVIAQWSEALYQIHRESFSIASLGEEQAWTLATEARKKAETAHRIVIRPIDATQEPAHKKQRTHY